MTKADLVERVTAQISRTAGPMISKKDCARVVDAFLESIKEALQAPEEHRSAWLRHVQDPPSQDAHGAQSTDGFASRSFRRPGPGLQAVEGAPRHGRRHRHLRARR